jgi:hypothetical protein
MSFVVESIAETRKSKRFGVHLWDANIHPDNWQEVAMHAVAVDLQRPAALPSKGCRSSEGFVPLSAPNILYLDWPGAMETAGYVPIGPILRRDAWARVIDAARKLPQGFGFGVYSAWMPPEVARRMPVARDEDPDVNDSHATGGVINLTLTFDGQPIRLGEDPQHRYGVLVAENALLGLMQERGFVMRHDRFLQFEYRTPYWAGITGSGTFLYDIAEPNVNAQRLSSGEPLLEARTIEFAGV